MSMPEGDTGPAAARTTAPNPVVRGRGRYPTAVTVVGAIVVLSIALNLAIGFLLLAQVNDAGVFAQGVWGALVGSSRTLARHGGAGADATLASAQVALVRAVYSIVVSVVLAAIAVGFVRVRRWSWVALMTWSGFNLAVQLYVYLTGDPETPGMFMRALTALDAGRLVEAITRTPSYGVMTLHALQVLALNMEEVQLVFGVRQQRAG